MTDANAIFEDELTLRGLAFERIDDDAYKITVDGTEVTASLTNVRRDAERDADPDRVRRFVAEVLRVLGGQPAAWEDAAPFVLFAAESAEVEVGDTLREPISDELVRLVTLTDAEQSRIALVTPAMCARWGVDQEQVVARARSNMNDLLAGVSLEVQEAAGAKLGMVPLDGPYKASVIFAPAFKQLVEPLGWPVMVVIPCRDFIYVVEDGSPLLGRLGSVVVREYQSSGYPLSTEVFRVSDDGIEAVGQFATKET